MQEDDQKLFHSALEAQKKAYAPYSKFQVGAALKLKDSDEIFSGCNIENASFGATVCAERVAILKWRSQSDLKQDIEAICLVTSSPKGDVPCGMCLQVMAEFFSPETQIIIANQKGILSKSTWTKYLPEAFNSKNL